MARKIQLVVHKYKLGEEPKSYDYWLTKTIAERIAALEDIRYQYQKFFLNESDRRLHRVYKVIKSSRG